MNQKNLPPTLVIDGKVGKIPEGLLTYRGNVTHSDGTALSNQEKSLLAQSQGAFGTVRLVQSLWHNTLDSFPKMCPITGCTPMCKAIANWANQTPLVINPHAECLEGCRLNAYYDPQKNQLVLPQFTHNSATKYTSSSFDVVAHEAGHACLNAMLPVLNSSGRLDHAALHECFGDMSALFASLALAAPHQQSVWLSEPHLSTCIGGDLTGSCIRDPHDIQSIACEAHSLSKPLTRLMCRYLSHKWLARKEVMTAQQVIDMVQKDFLEAIFMTKDSDNILVAMIHYLNHHKTAIEGSYLFLLTHQFKSCAVAA